MRFDFMVECLPKMIDYVNEDVELINFIYDAVISLQS